MSWTLDGRPLHRVLVTRLRYLGDVIMSTPLLDVLRAGDPDLELGYLCEAPHHEVLRADPRLAHLHVLRSDRRSADARARAVLADAAGAGPGTGPGPALHPGGAWTVWRFLRAARYDLAVDLYFNPRSAWLLRLAGVPGRVCGRRTSRARLYTHVAPRPDDRPRIAELAPGGLGEHLARLAPLRHEESGLPFLDWFEKRGEPATPRLTLAPTAAERAAAALAAAGFAGGPYVTLAPGATWPAKGWVPERWARTAAAFTEAGVPTVVLAPPGGEPGLATALADVPCTKLPPLDLGAALGVVAGGRGLVAVDGGVTHAAVALGVPTVALFGPTDPDIWFPYVGLGPYRVLATRPHCHPCDLHVCDDWICMPGLEPEDVLAAATAVMLGRDRP